MKRSFFIAAAASAVSISRPLLARAGDDRAKPVPIEANVKVSGWNMWHCGSAVVWLNIASGIYYYKGDRWYGRTKRGAYTCESEAINAGNRPSLDGQ